MYVAGQAGFSLNQDGYVAQIDSEGTFQWSRSTAGTGNTTDNMRGVVADASDNVYATGTNIGANPDWITAKYDVDGNLQWLQTLTGTSSSNDYGHNIGLDASGRVYVEGTFVVNAEDYGFAIYTAAGSLTCSDRFNGPGPSVSPNDISAALAVIPGGGAYVTGTSLSSLPRFDYFTIKYNTSCGREWIRRYDSGADGNATAAVVDASGGVFVTGSAGPSGNPPPAKGILTLHYDASGNQTGPALYHGSAGENDGATDIALDASGVYVTGYIDLASDSKMVTLAYTPGLLLRWIETYAEGTGYQTFSFGLDSSGAVYAAGNSEESGVDYALIKYCSETDGDGLSNCEEVSGVEGKPGLGGPFFTDPFDPDTDDDGCNDGQEVGADETLGGRRDPTNPWDYYDVLGPGAALPTDGVIDLPNDILGVIQHFSPHGQPPYDVQFDRGVSSGPNPWNMTAPDGVIDLPNDVLGVILQFNHNCA